MKNIENDVLHIIDDTIKSVWENKIAVDYKENWLMNEDTLKNVFYFHLRYRLEYLLKQNDLRIFTEFRDAEFSGSGYIPDIVIARIDNDTEAETWREAITECVAVIELKFQYTIAGAKRIYADCNRRSPTATGAVVNGHSAVRQRPA